MSYSKDMKDFMMLAGQQVGVLDLPQAHRYIRHLKEEAWETHQAWLADDMVKTIDGLVDSIVVALGGLYSLGINPDDAWNAVHAANMRKVDGSLGPIVRRKDGQIGKPEGWHGPEMELASIYVNRVEAA